MKIEKNRKNKKGKCENFQKKEIKKGMIKIKLGRQGRAKNEEFCGSYNFQNLVNMAVENVRWMGVLYYLGGGLKRKG